MSEPDAGLRFDRGRVTTLLDRLEAMAAGDTRIRAALSPMHDELDAIAYGINVLAEELRWTHTRMIDAERRELRRSKEEAERANESKSEFLRTASHEIRTPIAAILGIADMLALGGSIEENVDLVARLRVNCRALLALVGNVLDLSRLEADKIALTLEPVAPLELLREVVDSFEPDARRKGVEVRIENAVNPAAMIQTDRLRFRQILVNLVGNALKFTASGSIAISSRLGNTAGVAQLTIDVADTGIGIEPEQRPYLFEPFGQANSLIARDHGGTGLGLAVSRRLAHQLGGSLILLRSEPGRGSTFRFAMRARLVSATFGDSPSEHTTTSSAATKGALDGVRVLLAEDNADLRLSIGRALRLDGAFVDYASDGREAIAMIGRDAFDVVLMDVKMPVMSGLHAARVLRAAGCRLPIVALSADASSECRAASIDAGCSAFLTKPFDRGDLTASILFLRHGVLDASPAAPPLRLHRSDIQTGLAS